MQTKNYKDFCPTKQTRIVAKKTAYSHQKITKKMCNDPCLYGRNPCNFWFAFWEKRWPHKFILNLADLYQKLIFVLSRKRKEKHGDSQELILDSWQVASSGFFLPKIVPEERVFCEKQSRFIVKYGEIVNTARYCQNS
jgi:hypothetical protein